MSVESQRQVSVTLNGSAVSFVAPVRESLADSLRHRCHIRSVHLGCEHGVCGACTVTLDDVTVRSCLLLAAQADGHVIDTVEAAATAADADLLPRLQESFSRHHALQCGFCTPGFLLAARELIAETERPEELNADAVRHGLSGNLCRCTGYQNIIAAVLDVAKQTTGTEEQS